MDLTLDNLLAAKKALEAITVPMNYIKFDDCTSAASIGISPMKDMETTMNLTTVDTTLNARRAIGSAIYSVQCAVVNTAEKKFGLVESRRPQTAAELVEWIKADDFILPKIDDEDYCEEDYRYEKFLGLTFPPKIKRDRTGYDKFMDDFRKDKSSLELEVQVLEPADALKNFKKFESKWIH